MVIKVTNFPQFMRDLERTGRSTISQVVDRNLTQVPDSLETFFDQNPEVCENNVHLTSTPHLPLKRDGVLFLTQRRQATSDIRENPAVQIIGSHAAMTCHIVIMRHTESHVASLGHFDNFSCWQFGEENSAHKEGIRTMIEEIEFLSKDDLDKGHIQVSVFGGYTDPRGDARQNSMSLLTAFQQSDRVLEIVHFCVGPYNTCQDKDGNNTAVLIGVAIDLSSQHIFPATFPWNNFEDFSTQLQDKFLRRTGQGSILKDEEYCKTKNSTFKPKALRNPNTYKNLQKNLPPTDVNNNSSKSNPSSTTATNMFGQKLRSPAVGGPGTMSKEFRESQLKAQSRHLSEEVTLKSVKK